jgi:oligopeptide/dipeptide ABC transporter ATP-binding protein
MIANTKLLEVRDLVTVFDTDDGILHAVDGISFSLDSGETLGMVGESGCGKSVTALSVLGLISPQEGRIAGGRIFFEGRDLTGLGNAGLRKIRGDRISMIFQEPMTSLNPVFTVGDQIMEAIILHRGVAREEARRQTQELLGLVGIPAPEVRMREYPFQMSGGMRQRVMIAMAVSTRPALLIADEPTTALDVTIQAQILDLLRRLREQLNMSMLLITHDLGVVAEVVSRIVVVYAGRIVEEAPAERLFHAARHPYTIGLLGSIPRLDERRNRLQTIPGNAVSLINPPGGCRFHPRCARAMPRCRLEEPELLPVAAGHRARCWLAADEHQEGRA